MFFKYLSSAFFALTLASSTAKAEFTNNVDKPVLTQKSNNDSKKSSSKNLITLSDNTIVMRGEVSGYSVSKTITALMTASGDTVHLFLSSPGGSVLDGIQLVQAIRSINKKVVCVTDFSASMSFVILQACDERVVLESSVLMQHVPSFGLRHQPQPNAIAFVEFLKQITTSIDVAQSKRMELPLERFRQLIRDDYWLFGQEAVTAKAADRVARAVCTPDLTAKEDTDSFNVMGVIRVDVTWSKCPLVTEPKSVQISRMGTLSPEQEQKLQKEITRIVDYKADARRMINEGLGVRKDFE